MYQTSSYDKFLSGAKDRVISRAIKKVAQSHYDIRVLTAENEKLKKYCANVRLVCFVLFFAFTSLTVFVVL